MSSSPTQGPNLWRHVYAGTTLALTILGCIYVGYRVDRHWQTRPWGILVGAFFGIGVGLYNFLREFLNDETAANQRH